MAKPDIEVKAGGKTYRLSFPIGALEEIARVNPYIEELWQAFAGIDVMGRVQYLYKLEEMVAVITAGLKWGGEDIAAEDFIEIIRVERARKVCFDGLRAAIVDDAPEKKSGRASAQKGTATAS